MLGVLNEAEFADPARRDRWLMKSRGWDERNRRAEGGLRDPHELKIRRGAILFRIGHSRSRRGTVPDDVNLSSPWWMTDETFVDICQSATTLGMELQGMARLKLSVSERYGVFDTIFWVRVRETLGAFRGTGVPVYDVPEEGQPAPPPAWAWPGREVPQFFIPGLRGLDDDRPTGLADRAFRPLPTQPVHGWHRVLEGGFTEPA